jgi:hypothetical protein
MVDLGQEEPKLFRAIEFTSLERFNEQRQRSYIINEDCEAN